MDNKKSYFAIIPANVRYDKRLKLLSRLLYGEITALCNEKGYCWANNKYFADLFEVSVRTISACISQLNEFGYIKIEMQQKNNSKEVNRFIIINTPPLEENFYTPRKNFLYPLEENFQDNNTINNTINNNKIDSCNFKKPKIEEIIEYCKERKNDINAEKFFNYYESIGWMVGKHKMKNWKSAIITWEQNAKKYSTKPIKTTTTFNNLPLVGDNWTEEDIRKLRG